MMTVAMPSFVFCNFSIVVRTYVESPESFFDDFLKRCMCARGDRHNSHTGTTLHSAHAQSSKTGPTLPERQHSQISTPAQHQRCNGSLALQYHCNTEQPLGHFGSHAVRGQMSLVHFGGSTTILKMSKTIFGVF